MKKQKKLTVSEATERLADILNDELAKLPAAEQRKRAKAFHGFVTSRVGSAASSRQPAQTLQSRLAARARG